MQNKKGPYGSFFVVIIVKFCYNKKNCLNRKGELN